MLLRDAEPVVNTAAYFFEEVGLGRTARALRSGLPLVSSESALAVALVLFQAQANEKVSELAFWSAGAILAAADGEIDLFHDCLGMVEKCVDQWEELEH
jgi:hypothetical protein